MDIIMRIYNIVKNMMFKDVKKNHEYEYIANIVNRRL